MPVRFAFLTDTHHYPDAPEDYGAPKMLTRSQEVLDAIPPALNAQAFDFAVHGGDFLCGGSSFDLPTETYLRSIDEAATAFARLEAPFYSIPGNHDCDAQSGSFEGFAARFPYPDPLTVVDAAPRLRLALANVFHDCDVFEKGSGVWTDALGRGSARCRCSSSSRWLCPAARSPHLGSARGLLGQRRGRRRASFGQDARRKPCYRRRLHRPPPHQPHHRLPRLSSRRYGLSDRLPLGVSQRCAL